MQSAILSFLGYLFSSAWAAFKRSGTYALFDRVYSSISSAWQKSAIVNTLKKDADTDGISRESVTYKIFHLPFSFMNFLKNTAGDWAKKSISESFVISLCKTVLHNMLALNTRFLGTMLLAAAAARMLSKLLLYHAVSGKFVLIGGFLSFLLCLTNFNFTSFLEHSALVGVVQKLFKLNVRFDFYKERATHGKIRLAAAIFIGAASGILIHKSVLLAMAFPLAIFVLFVTLYAPIAGIYLAVFSAPFVPTMALAALCLLTLFSLLIKSVTTSYFRWRFDAMGVGIIFLLLLFFASSLASFSPSGSLMVWSMYFVFMTFYFVIINTVKTKKQLFGLLKAFAIGGAFVAFYGILQYVFGWNTKNAWIDTAMFEDATMRVYSTLENPNVLGEYLLLVLPISAGFLFFYKERETWLAKAVFGIITAMIFVCLILTQSRGCWLGFILGTVIFITFVNGRLWGLVPVILCILPLAVPQTIVHRLMSIGNMSDSSTSYRVYIWLGTISMLKDFWIGGIGMGEKAFNCVYPFYSYNTIVAPHSHNLFLQFMTESGIAALLAFIVLMVIFVKKMIVSYHYGKKNDASSIMSIAFISGVSAFLLQSLFDYTFYNYRVMAMFFMFLAFGMSLKYIVKVGGIVDKIN
ncbi:MAG: O-antigen ligase family protein [Clostridia bacterium]|nr:O-antigen ligase family protein [Clostridia bacterium]